VGIKQVYGNGAVQYLTAGKGVLHEEMWDLDGWGWNDIELYQIWVNLPSTDKRQKPSLQLIGLDQLKPIPILNPSEGVTLRLVLGEVGDVSSGITTATPMAVIHATLDPGAVWEFDCPPGHNAFFYQRRGRVVIPKGSGRGTKEVKVETHETCFFQVNIRG